MKDLSIGLLLSFVSFVTVGQDFIEGQVLMARHKTDKLINTHSRTFHITLYADHKYLNVYLDSLGRFKIERAKVAELGPTINFSIGMSTTFLNYADFELVDIPLDSIDIFLSKVYATKAYVNWRCGNDCYSVNNIRTYWRRKFFVSNGRVKYRVNRIPRRGLNNNPRLEVKYQASCVNDLR